MRVIFVTGLSGGGKSTALRALEDLSFFCVDNLPLPVVGGLCELLSPHSSDIAVSVDGRQERFLPQFEETLRELRGRGYSVEVLFLEADDEVLIRRYSETRRTHPVGAGTVPDGISREKDLLAPLREHAAVLNTTSLNVHQLKGIVEERFGRSEGKLAVTFLSFGFKHGVPPESDLVFDVRFLPNPYFVPELSASDGRQDSVAEFVLGSDEGSQTLEKIHSYVDFSLPRFRTEGKRYLTVAVGCTGGRHRSVAVTESLAASFGGEWDVVIRHRDLVGGGEA